MTHRGPFQPLLFCDSVTADRILWLLSLNSYANTTFLFNRGCFNVWIKSRYHSVSLLVINISV